MKRHATAAWLALAYAAFIVYGSLVPLEFRPLPLGEAWQRFLQTPFLALDIDSRADWVANGVLYAPLGFFAARAAFGRGVSQAASVLLSIVGCCALAIGVEYIQLYFPPRTVSLNDILAECIGSVVGAVVAPVLASWLQRLAQGWSRGGTTLLPRVLELYTGAYLLLCFFPYDLLLSTAELHQKWVVGRWSWWIAPHDHGLFFVALQWAVEVAIALPIGALPWLRGSAGRPASTDRLSRAAVFGLALGAVIEVGQFFMYSGVSQGVSVLSRGLGVMLGAAATPWLESAGWDGVRRFARPWALLLALGYLLLLAGVNRAFGPVWHGFGGVPAAWHATHLLPFYYHYYTTEALALFSLGSVALMYAPVVGIGWLRGWSTALTAGITAALVLTVEAAKLFMVDGHADPTNVLVAVSINAMLCGLLALAQRPDGTSAGDAARVDLRHRNEIAAGSSRALWWLFVPVALAATATFPRFGVALTIGLAIAAVVVWRRPVLALGLIPAALPLLDLAPWTGRFFVDEFDLLQVVCLAAAFARLPACSSFRSSARSSGRADGESAGRIMSAAWLLLGVSLLLSTWRGLAGIDWRHPIGLDSFDSYDSPYNALRIVKGALDAWLFAVLWHRLGAQGERRASWFGGGMLFGLAGTVLVVVWERLSFSGLFDFAADFRVTGPFSAMHKGGAYIECYLAVAAAFAIAAVVRPGAVLRRGFAAMLLAATCYAVAVTYSRNGYIALALVVGASLVITFVGLSRGSTQRRQRRQRLIGAIAVAALFAIALPVVFGGYARERLSQSGHDLAVRRAHWADGLALRDPGVVGRLFGMGIGRYPEVHRLSSAEPLHAASYSLGDDVDQPGGGRYLRLGSGATLYIDQIVDRPKFAALTASFEMRGVDGQAMPGVSLCEKWTLTSLGCAIAAPPRIDAASASASAPASVSGSAAIPGPAPAVASTTGGQAGTATESGRAAQGWRRVTVSLDASRLLLREPPWRAPWKLSLATPAKGSVDVRNVRLVTPFDDELISNGDFRQGLDHWFFSTDIDPPWHLHSLPVAVLFDQGWFGVVAWSAVMAMALATGARLLLRGTADVPAAWPAVIGFLASGTLNTLIDAPRFLWLLLVLAWLATRRRPMIEST